MGQYGNAIPGRLGTNEHHIIGQIETSLAGNTVLRCGRTEWPSNSWTQSLHIVLTPDETQALIDELTNRLNEKPALTAVPCEDFEFCGKTTTLIGGLCFRCEERATGVV